MAETPLQVSQPQASSPETPSVVEVLIDAAKTNVLKVQDYAKLSFRSLTNLATSPRYMQDTLVQMDDIGVGSLPIVFLSGFFIGAVLVLQTGAQFERFGQTMLTGDVVSIALVRELGPTITGLLVAGRCASGMASELGSMQVTEQVDAMRAMGTDPSRKLVSPRVLATLLTLPLLTTISVFVGLLGHIGLDGIDELAGDVADHAVRMLGPQGFARPGVDLEHDRAGLLGNIDLTGVLD